MSDEPLDYLVSRIGEILRGHPVRDLAESISHVRHEIARLRSEIADLKVSVIAFGAPAAVERARVHGLPPGHLYPSHYDMLAAAGARMTNFTRGEPPK